MEAWKREQTASREMFYNLNAHLQWWTFSSKIAPHKLHMALPAGNLISGDGSDLFSWKCLTHDQSFYQPSLCNETNIRFWAIKLREDSSLRYVSIYSEDNTPWFHKKGVLVFGTFPDFILVLFDYLQFYQNKVIIIIVLSELFELYRTWEGLVIPLWSI